MTYEKLEEKLLDIQCQNCGAYICDQQIVVKAILKIIEELIIEEAKKR